MNISIAAEPLFWFGSFPITNAFLLTLIVSGALIVTSLIIRGRFTLVPKGFQNLLETLVEAVWALVLSMVGNRERARMFFPLVMTLFVFILLSNWAGLLPGSATVGIHEHGMIVPFLRGGMADLNTTLALSIIAVLGIQIAGVSILGWRGYAKKFFVAPWHKPYIVGTVVGILELMSEVTRMVSFSFRLFGNIFAGEVLLIVVGSLIPYILPVPFLVMEIFVGIIQAGVFALLTLVFLKMATVPAEH